MEEDETGSKGSLENIEKDKKVGEGVAQEGTGSDAEEKEASVVKEWPSISAEAVPLSDQELNKDLYEQQEFYDQELNKDLYEQQEFYDQELNRKIKEKTALQEEYDTLRVSAKETSKLYYDVGERLYIAKVELNACVSSMKMARSRGRLEGIIEGLVGCSVAALLGWTLYNSWQVVSPARPVMIETVDEDVPDASLTIIPTANDSVITSTKIFYDTPLNEALGLYLGMKKYDVPKSTQVTIEVYQGKVRGVTFEKSLHKHMADTLEWQVKEMQKEGKFIGIGAKNPERIVVEVKPSWRIE